MLSACLNPPPPFQGDKSTDSGSTFWVCWHKSGQVLHFGFKNSVLGPQHTFPLVAVLLESCGITIFPSISEKKCSSVSLRAVFASYAAQKAVALVVYALGLNLGSPRFKPSFSRTGKFFNFATAINLLGLSNTHTKCKETLLVSHQTFGLIRFGLLGSTRDTRHTAVVGAVGTWY